MDQPQNMRDLLFLVQECSREILGYSPKQNNTNYERSFKRVSEMLSAEEMNNLSEQKTTTPTTSHHSSRGKNQGFRNYRTREKIGFMPQIHRFKI